MVFYYIKFGQKVFSGCYNKCEKTCIYVTFYVFLKIHNLLIIGMIRKLFLSHAPVIFYLLFRVPRIKFVPKVVWAEFLSLFFKD